MSKHTPGPWQAVTFSDEHSPCIIDAEGDGRIAELTGNQTDEQTEANAALIAAAPDLLEALIEAMCWLPGQGTPAQRGAKCETAWDLLKMVNAAIAKAAGWRRRKRGQHGS